MQYDCLSWVNGNCEKPDVSHSYRQLDFGRGFYVTAVREQAERCGSHFSDEDCYIYFLAHAYKHYDREGTGVRTFLDLWLYRRRKTAMDETYIAGELKKLGLTDFERGCRSAFRQAVLLAAGSGNIRSPQFGCYEIYGDKLRVS